jgi:hypothetical protein
MLSKLSDNNTTAPLMPTALIGLAILFAPASDATGTDAHFQSWSRQPMCTLWDGQASKAIVRKVTESEGDVDLQSLGEDLSRMQRARRNCDLGMVGAACEDYLAVMRNVGGTSSEWRRSVAVCSTAIAEEPSSGPVEARTE